MEEKKKRPIIKCHGETLEDLYFMEHDKKLIKKMRKEAKEEATENYRGRHSYHCFRCGTESLVVMNFRDVEIDVCVNENCGCVHLDPGELKVLAKGESNSLLRGIQRCLFGLP